MSPADDAAASSRLVKLCGRMRAMLALELLVFALPCYLIYGICILLSVLGLGVVFDMLMDAATRPQSEALKDLREFLPYVILSVTAFAGLPALVMFAGLVVRVFRRSITVELERSRLERILKWGALPIMVMMAMLFAYRPRSPHSLSETLQAAIISLYVSGLPILVPAFHLRRLFAGQFDRVFAPSTAVEK